ncbi:hypothetical protein A8C75_11615 [Marinobacterium aestuarii]|uniref:TnsA endonuclease N-terminal domain-containing protein n=2 Tax=Marinobacterium aestuarii TaxID=1821621 RepID=A0A1A9EYM8_9GAMM|nr:hypothetical protein A8C75_11615 [Marinobacterium aestuarii]
MYLESYTELAKSIELEMNNNIIYFNSQPLSIEYQINGKSRRYTPDFFVKEINVVAYFIEVKSDLKELSEKEKNKFNILAELFNKAGFNLKVQFISYKSQATKNAIFLYRYLDNAPLNLNNNFRFKGDIASYLNEFKYDNNLADLYYKMARGEVKFDINKPIDFTTVIEL